MSQLLLFFTSAASSLYLVCHQFSPIFILVNCPCSRKCRPSTAPPGSLAAEAQIRPPPPHVSVSLSSLQLKEICNPQVIYAGHRILLNFSTLVIKTRSGHFYAARLQLRSVSSESQLPCRCTSPDLPATSSSKGDTTLQLARSIQNICNLAQTHRVRVTTGGRKRTGFQRMPQRPKNCPKVFAAKSDDYCQ